MRAATALRPSPAMSTNRLFTSIQAFLDLLLRHRNRGDCSTHDGDAFEDLVRDVPRLEKHSPIDKKPVAGGWLQNEVRPQRVSAESPNLRRVNELRIVDGI